MSNEKTTPIAVEKFTDNGEFSHYDIVDQTTGKVLWSSPKPSPTPLSAEEIIKFYLDSDRTKISIQNCMEEYASQQTAQLRQQVEELQKEAETQKGLATRYHQFWRDLIAKIEEERKWLKDTIDENLALKERNEKMEGAIKDVLLYRSAETLEIYSSSSRATSALLELQQSLNKE